MKTYRIQILEYLGYGRTKTGKSMPSIGKTRTLTLKTNMDVDEVKAEIARKLNIPTRNRGRPGKK